MRRADCQDLHTIRQFDEEFGVSSKVMNTSRIAASQARHRLDALPIRNRHELRIGFPVLSECLYSQGFLEERLDADLVVVFLVLIGAVSRRPPPPDARNSRSRLVSPAFR